MQSLCDLLSNIIWSLSNHFEYNIITWYQYIVDNHIFRFQSWYSHCIITIHFFQNIKNIDVKKIRRFPFKLYLYSFMKYLIFYLCLDICGEAFEIISMKSILSLHKITCFINWATSPKHWSFEPVLENLIIQTFNQYTLKLNTLWCSETISYICKTDRAEIYAIFEMQNIVQYIFFKIICLRGLISVLNLLFYYYSW